ncbi:MAG: hypothetical protein GY865_00190 [candidate division Zixibacteria bacterium]|nr:hypothetical protein [candidate division Zixibacteria bacterium]
MTRSERWRKLFDELGLIQDHDLVIPEDIHELIFMMRDGSKQTIRNLDDKSDAPDWKREIKGEFFISWRRHKGDESWVDDKHTASFGGNPWVAEKYILIDDIAGIEISREL